MAELYEHATGQERAWIYIAFPARWYLSFLLSNIMRHLWKASKSFLLKQTAS